MIPNIQKMSRKFGRRAKNRFSIPGATVSWAYKEEEIPAEETTPLSDISLNGLSLLTNTPPQEGSDIFLRVNLPKQPGCVDFHARTIYSMFRGPGLTYEYRVGTQFKPFSDAEGDNAPQSKEILEELEQLYGKRMEVQDVEV